MIDAIARYPVAANALPPYLGAQLWPHAAIVKAKAGRTVLALGAQPTSVLLLLEGRVQAALFSSGGAEVVLRDLSAGALFGELGAIDGQPRSASIVALDDSTIASIPGKVFCDLVCETPEGALWLARRLVAQVRELSEKVFELNALRVPGRLHCELLRLCHATANGDAASGRIEHFPTHAELAARIGTHREAITREIGFLTASGVLVPGGNRTMTIEVARLTALIQDSPRDLGAGYPSWPAAQRA